MSPAAALILRFVRKFLIALTMTVMGGLVGLAILLHMLLADDRLIDLRGVPQLHENTTAFAISELFR